MRILWPKLQLANSELKLAHIEPETSVLAIQLGRKFYYSAYLREQCARQVLADLKRTLNPNSEVLFRSRPIYVVDFSTLKKVF